MAPKLEDPDAFTIPCTIGSANFAKALYDLGASINLMPYSVFKTLGIGKPRATSIRLQMADRTMKRPLGIVDDVLIQVEMFIFPTNFVILDCEPNSSEVCSFVDLVTVVIANDTGAMINVEDPLEAVLLNLDVNKDEGRVECVNALHGMGSYSYEPWKLSLDLENRRTPPTKPSTEEPPVVVYPISDGSWTSPVQCVLKKGGMTVVTNVQNELIPTRTVTRWRMCMDYCKLNKVTHKDHFPLPFLDQMLGRLAGYALYCLLDGYSGYNQILIAPKDQEKTTFTCPYGTFAFYRMPFELCNAPATCQRCMMAIFTDMVEDILEVFMDDFNVVGGSLDECFKNLDRALARCKETNLVLNWEKYHFMVEDGIVLVHKISKHGIEVNKAKIEVISKLPPPTSVKGVRSFLGHAGFYMRSIKDFSKVVNPLCKLLEKDAKFMFNEECMIAFELLKYKLTTTPIITAPNWRLPFELICDEGRPRDGLEINDSFPNEQVLFVSVNGMTWFADVANFLVTGIAPCELSSNQRKKLKRDSLDYYWDEPYLFKICIDGVIQRCVPEEEQLSILEACHSSPYGGHHGGVRKTSKVLICGFYWPTLYKDASELVKRCDECQRASGISKKDEIPLNTILEVDIFDVWGIDFMGPFVSSCDNTYILVAVDYVSKWVEGVALPNNISAKYDVVIVAPRADELIYVKPKIEVRRLMEKGNVLASVQVDVSNREIKCILSREVNANRTDWSKKLDDALWAYRNAYKTLIGFALGLTGCEIQWLNHEAVVKNRKEKESPPGVRDEE
ncbi:uncharacterized protein [Nicotiana sylvestris]|uniref:uncharacterized protein n=1 Tax=Nicotiana sylvestris TaxID=4096 RepID=UPI00388CBDB7